MKKSSLGIKYQTRQVNSLPSLVLHVRTFLSRDDILYVSNIYLVCQFIVTRLLLLVTFAVADEFVVRGQAAISEFVFGSLERNIWASSFEFHSVNQLQYSRLICCTTYE